MTVFPIGYVGILDAARMLQPAMYAGTPDPPAVITLRQKDINVGDRQALHRAVDELWNGVDAGTLRAMAIGGRPRRIVRLDPALTKAIPTLRSPRGRGFTSLRQSNPLYMSWRRGLGRIFPGSYWLFERQRFGGSPANWCAHGGPH